MTPIVKTVGKRSQSWTCVVQSWALDANRQIRWLHAAGPRRCLENLRKAGIDLRNWGVQDPSTYRRSHDPQAWSFADHPYTFLPKPWSGATAEWICLPTDRFVLAQPGESLAQATYRQLQAESDCPLLPEWAEPLTTALIDEEWLAPWTGSPHAPAGADILGTEEALAAIVAARVQAGMLPIPNGPGGTVPDPLACASADIYIRRFAPALQQRALQQSTRIPDIRPARTVGARTLFPAQATAAAALNALWDANIATGWLVGEPSVGKTTVAVTSARDHLAGRPGRIAVFCPPHLVPKWGREIQILMPDSQVHCPKTPADVVAAMSLPPTGPEFWIFSRDRLKRQWYWRWGARPASSAAQARWAATHPRSLPLQWVCPDCGAPLATPHARPRSVEWVPWNQPDHRSPSVAVCPTCSAPLWQANRDGPRQLTWPDQWRRAPASVTFDLLLADEVHEEKGQSFQSQVLADLMRRSHRHAFLTGTILGGMARDVFYHLWRSDPRAMQAAGYQYNQPQQFARDYGRVETHLDGANRVRRRVERPGIHPALFGDWLLERTIFLDLADLHAALPSYTERVELVTMDPAQAECVTAAYAAMRDALQDHRAPDGSIRLGSYVQNALTYPDRTGSAAPLTLPGGDAWVPPAPTAPDRLLPKTARIIQLCLAQKAQGRRVLVFLEYPNLFQVDGLIRELEEFDLRVAHLTPKVPTAQRETWLRDHLADVLICQPRLMGTGLDAIEYPTIIWAQTGYSLLTVQQASRRSYRIGQTQPVNVIFLAYEGTLQARALTLLSEKAQAAAAISGHFDEHSLRLWAPADSMAMQLAEALALGMTLRAEHAAAQNPAPTPEPTAWPARPTKAPRRRADSPHQLHFGFDCARVH